MADSQEQTAKQGLNATERMLQQIREDFAYVRAYWYDDYEQSSKDMDVIAGKAPRQFTDDRPNRPVIWPDETTQYVNQANNNLRQTPRSIKLSPKEEATDVDAEHRQSYIRGIEDASKAQSVYTNAFESAVQCGFGHWRMTIIATGKGKFEPRLRRIPNWASVYRDPDAKEADFSDSNLDFVIDSMRETTFGRKFPKAQKRSFTADDRAVAPDWLNGGNVVVAEYWIREQQTMEDGEVMYDVRQYLTNGVELLKEPNWDEDDVDENGCPCLRWIGSSIPIFTVTGKEIYTRTGGQSKRMYLSMIRNGRPAAEMLAYYASQEAEEVGMAPRAALQGLKGTFINADQTWKVVNKVPMAYLEYGIPDDWNDNWGKPDPPMRAPFTPNFQAYEAGYERWRRILQASVAGTPLPTDAQRVNDKSGVALEKIENAGMLGNFHFTDNFVRALHHCGEQLNECITKLAESDSLPEEVLGKDKEGKDVRLNVMQGDSSEVPPEDSEALPEASYFFARRGKYTVTVSDGPSYASEREESSAFADKLLETVPRMGLPPQITMQVMSIATKLKNLGAMGDKLAEIFDPADQSAQQLQQAQAQIQQFQQEAAKLAQEVEQLKLERAGKVIDNEYKLHFQQLQNDIKILTAEIEAKAQSESERAQMFMEFWKENHGAAHEVALQKDQQAHDASQLQAQTQLAQAQAAQNPNPSNNQSL